MITKEEVRHAAKLARIGITEEEEERFQRDLFLILEYVEKLKKVDISKTLPTSHPFKIENAMRPDAENPRLRQGFHLRPSGFGGQVGGQAKLLDLAPEIKEGYIKVKSILK